MPYTHVFKHLPNSGEKQIPYKIVLQQDTTNGDIYITTKSNTILAELNLNNKHNQTIYSL